MVGRKRHVHSDIYCLLIYWPGGASCTGGGEMEIATAIKSADTTSTGNFGLGHCQSQEDADAPWIKGDVTKEPLSGRTSTFSGDLKKPFDLSYRFLMIDLQ